ncbi:MAG: hypothetical protein RQ826_01940 [Xanthomonadales bacterium]|nr:hypothetical protein [Xanthomonadales bacterium]
MVQKPTDFSNFQTVELRQSLHELLGIARGLMADQQLSDGEIDYLKQWLDQRSELTASFPGNVIYERVKHVLADGVVTEEERSHLVEMLNMLTEERLEDLAERVDLDELWFDEVGLIQFDKTRFCLTGNFVYGPIAKCTTAVEQRGGTVVPKVGEETQYLVVGALGVDEWRSGGMGEKIEQAMRLRGQGKPLKIIPEDSWVVQL